MTQRLRTLGFGATLAAMIAMLVSSGASVHAQQLPPPGQLLSADQLDYMVAPIALYPDPLISQILVATTYPLEIVEASQWLQRNPNIRGEALTQAALNQDWDPSVQALVVFPDVLKYLTEDISWTTNLGNAFLAQEGDVMDAIQRMRDRAAQSGKLRTTSEQRVIRVEDSVQPVYEILPADPTVIYVPVYDPYWIWGAPVYYPYARWYYPSHAPYLYFSSPLYIDAYFGSGWYGSAWYGPGYRVWNNWGWRPAWTSHNVVVNNVFIDNHHFNSNRSHVATGTTAWSHDAGHRRGVVYPAAASFDRYRRDPRDVPRPQQVQGQGRSVPAQVGSRSTGTGNAPGTVERSNVRPDVRQDARLDSRQDSRPAARPDTRQDTRVAGRDSTPNSPNRNDRGSSDFRGDRGNSYQSSNRIASSPTPVTPSRPAQATLSRPSTPAPALSSSQASSRIGAQYQAPSRESQLGRSAGTAATRSQSSTPSRETVSTRVGPSDYATMRRAGPGAGASPSTYQASPARESVPAGRYAPSQQIAPSANAQRVSPRQEAPSSGAASAVRSVPSQQQATPSSNGQGNGRESSSGTSHGGNSRGRR